MIQVGKEMDTRRRIILAAEKAVAELIKIAGSTVSVFDCAEDGDDSLSSDKLKSAAQTKKIAVFDAFDILDRIEIEKEKLKSLERGEAPSKSGFAERRAGGAV